MTVVAYGAGIQEAIAEGDLKKMKAMLKVASANLKEYGNLAAAIEVLKIEIAKLELQRKRRK
jgi:hypothetical protein